MIAGKRDLAAAAGGGCSCKGMACGCDIVDDNMGDDCEGMCRKSLKRNKKGLQNERTRGDREISCLKL